MARKLNQTQLFNVRGSIMKLTLLSSFIFLLVSPAIAADVSIDMLSKQGKERMVFSESIVEINVGDTIFWKAKDKGHNVEFIKKNGVPDGVKKFKSKLSKDTQFTFEVPGIYAYWCSPHKSAGMIGFVIVGGDKSNIETIKTVKFRGQSKNLAKRLIAKIGM